MEIFLRENLILSWVRLNKINLAWTIPFIDITLDTNLSRAPQMFCFLQFGEQ